MLGEGELEARVSTGLSALDEVLGASIGATMSSGKLMERRLTRFTGRSSVLMRV